MKTAFALAACLLLQSCAGSNSAQDRSGLEPSSSRAHDFLRRLQRLAGQGNAEAIAEMIDYPIGVEIDEVTVLIDDAGEFVSHFGDIFTPGVRAAIECETPSKLREGQYGIRIGQGEIWASVVNEGGELRIYRINNGAWPVDRSRSDEECYWKVIEKF